MLGIISFMKTYKEDEVEVYSAQAAFFLMLSFIPFIACLTSLLSLTPVSMAFFEKVILDVLPSYLDDVFDPFFKSNYVDTNVVFSVSVVVGLWTASKGIQNLTIGLNKIFDVKETRSWLRVRVTSAIYTIIMLLNLILSLFFLVLGDHVHRWLTDAFPAGAYVLEKIASLRMVVVFVIMVVVFDLMYIALPNNNIRKAFKMHMIRMLPGAVIAAVCWFAISIAFYVAATYFGGFAFYGSVATLVMLMFWICACMITFMAGGLINRMYIDWLIKMPRRNIKKN